MGVCAQPGCPKLTIESYCPDHDPGYKGRQYRQARDEIKRKFTGQPCPLCGQRMDPATADHIERGNPKSALRAVCLSCNTAKRER